MSDKLRCAGRVWHNSWHNTDCRRVGRYEHNGKLWCKQHHPPSAMAARAERDDRNRAKWESAHRTRVLQRHARELLDLCREAVPLCSPAWRKRLAKIEASVSGEAKP